MYYLFEIAVALIIAYFFYKNERPKVRFLLYGYCLFFLVMFIQLPFRYLELQVRGYFDFALMSQILFAPILIAISEVTKYLSMKRFLNTKSFKNGIFFGIGWTTIESINFFTAGFFGVIFSIFAIKFDYSFLLNPDYGPVNFLLLFIVNLAITVFVIKSIIRKKYYYLAFAIVYSLVAFYGLLLLTGIEKLMFTFVLLTISTFILFNYKKFV